MIDKACLANVLGTISIARRDYTDASTHLLRIVRSCADVVIVTFRSANYQYEMSNHEGIRRLTILSSAATDKNIHNRVTAFSNTTDVPCMRQAYSES